MLSVQQLLIQVTSKVPKIDFMKYHVRVKIATLFGFKIQQKYQNGHNFLTE